MGMGELLDEAMEKLGSSTAGFVKVITLCGSYEEREAIHKLGEEMHLRGAGVVLVPPFPGDGRPDEDLKRSLMMAHFKRIELANRVILVVRDRMGTNTAMEAGYAMALGKPVAVHRLDPSLELADISDELVLFMKTGQGIDIL
jgi:nucleoside 2-deoxyribosyltransferase